MKLLAERITDYFIRNEITTEEMREENIYGIEVILGKVLTYTTLIVLGIWKQNIIHIIFFMVVFFSLRGRTGGYHASTRINCYIGTIIMFFLVTEVFVPFVRMSSLVMIIILILADVVIILFAPINHPNLGLSDEEIENCKHSARWLVMLFSCTVIMLWGLGIIPECMSYMVIGIGADAGLLILAKINKQEEETE